MEANSIEVDEVVPASRKLQADEAKILLAAAAKLIVIKGKKITEFAMKGRIRGDCVNAMLGPTGNLRSPTIRVGRTLLVGYHDDVYTSTFRGA